MKTTFFGLVALAAPAAAQVTFSVDYQGPTAAGGFPDSIFASPITEGDVLLPNAAAPTLGPLGQPGIAVFGGAAGLGLPLYPGGPVEVDALSYGLDGPADPGFPPDLMQWRFSADDFANGFAVPAAPNVFTEGALATGAWEASGDVFMPQLSLPGPLLPFGAPPANVGVIDGNGFISASGFGYPGTGLLEWNPPGPPPDLGDNLDALDADGPIGAMGIYFSLDSGFFDFANGVPNSGSAIANLGVSGGDVLWVPAGGPPPVVYAPAPLLGLDITGFDTDDLDALVIFENGVPGYQPSGAPYDWLGGGTDMLLFSVRRGSALILGGTLDGFGSGVPISESDILYPIPGGPPGIWYAGENLGLATVRSGFPVAFDDDLDALDLTRQAATDCDFDGREDAWNIAFGGAADCNANGLIDGCEIAAGTSSDTFNFNGVPDECECGAVSTYCTAKVNSLGCTPVIWSKGTPCALCPAPFTIDAVNIVSAKNGLLFYGFGPAAIPFQGGTLCVMPPLRRTPIMNSGGVFPPNTCTGSFTFDMNGWIQSGIDPALIPFTTVYAQYWYRDPASTFGVGLTNATTFTICP